MGGVAYTSYSVVIKADGSDVLVNVVNEKIDLKIKPLGFTFDPKLSS